MTTEARTVERLHADHGITKRLGLWTSASQFDVRVRYGVLVLDLRSPEIDGDVEIRLDLYRSVNPDDRPPLGREPGGESLTVAGLRS
jgi:hypothetical protein